MNTRQTTKSVSAYELLLTDAFRTTLRVVAPADDDGYAHVEFDLGQPSPKGPRAENVRRTST